MVASLDAQCVVNANNQFWEQMLAMTVDTKPMPADFNEAAGHVLCSVTLSGMWRGRVEVRLAKDLAQQATAAMLMQPVDTVAEADTLDAAKEIANMIAGVIKSSLPRPCSMTVPESAVAGEAFSSDSDSEGALVVVFRHTAGEMMVRVVEEECPGQASPARERVVKESEYAPPGWTVAACTV